MKKETRLILALDVLEKEKAISISESVSKYVDAIKIGYPLVLSLGLGIIKTISKFAPIIADFKVADIPNTNNLICTQTYKSGADAIIVHGFTGHDSLLECVNIGKKYNKDVFVVTEMSHPGAVDFIQPIAIPIACQAFKLGASGIVAPATRPERVKEIREVVGELTIISPGVGIQGGKASDVIKSGADYVIVGRSIYNSKNPEFEAEKIVIEIEKCL